MGTNTQAVIMNPAEILTPDELAARLKVPKSWIYDQTRHRAQVRNSASLPHRRMGRYLRFIWSEVVEWLDGQQTSAPTRPPSYAVVAATAPVGYSTKQSNEIGIKENSNASQTCELLR
jgi:hypothetical protein